MPPKNVATEILVFDFELFIGVLRAGETFNLLEGRGPIGKTESASDNLLTRLVKTIPRHTLSIGLYRLGGGGSLSFGLSRPALA